MTFAATAEEDGTGFTGICKMGPVRFPFVGCGVPVPAPSTELWDILLDRGCLIPVEAGLQQCLFKVLNQCSLGGRQVLKGLGTI